MAVIFEVFGRDREAGAKFQATGGEPLSDVVHH